MEFTTRELFVKGVSVIPIGNPTMVKLTLLLCDGLLVTVAVMVVAPPTGTTDGAV